MAVEVVLGAIGAVASLAAGLRKTWLVSQESKRNGAAAGNDAIKDPPARRSGESEPQKAN